nr:glycosyltransferase family 39 protein [Bacilli bacterium]
MKNFISRNKYIILTILILVSIMCYFITQKNGFHEDEIFSYGSSNYKYDNVYRWYGYAEADQDILYNQVLQGNLKEKISNITKYIKDNSSFQKDENLSKEIPIFRTKEEAKSYLVIEKNDIFNYFSVYYNQARDVHPPLFYFLVHFISSLFYGIFSKYIIFILNLIFFVSSLFIIKKIMKELKHDELTIPAMILYGASIGCISTVMFQRMYMMMTFFGLCYLCLTLKLINDNFEIKKKRWWIITILLGFLTQYYFCVYIAIIFMLISIYLLLNKQFKKWFKYLRVHIIPAISGIIFYPFSIEDIFFSYRGLGGTNEHTKTIMENINYYFTQIYELFGFKNILIFIIAILMFILIFKLIKRNLQKISKEQLYKMLILIIPIFIYILIMSKISPFLGEKYTSRYIMILFPTIAISIIYMSTFIFNKNTLLVTLLFSIILSINGFINNTPTYLYKDNKQVMELAKANSDKYFVYVFDNYFTHLSSMPEFATYKESIILNNTIHDFDILNNDKLRNSNEFILCIKNWLNQEEVLNKVLTSTGYTDYEVLLSLNTDVEATYYKISK